jgi:hypothetical protein
LRRKGAESGGDGLHYVGYQVKAFETSGLRGKLQSSEVKRMPEITDLSREDLLKLLEIYAKNWAAHDGCWFLAAEERYGLDTAMALDAAAWARFAPIEAERIKAGFGMPEHGGLAALEQALNLRMYALANKQEVIRMGDNALELRMMECRVQQARRRKGLADFPCRQVAAIHFPEFAKAIDSDIQTECLACPPDPVGEGYCRWRFTRKRE